MSAHSVSSSRPSSFVRRVPVQLDTLEFEEFESSIKFHELCAIASTYRDGILCQLGLRRVDWKYVKYELNFSDGTVWIARFPLPYCCFLSEETSASYAATLKFLRKNSTLPVPEVYGYCGRSDRSNKVNATYVLTQRLDGRSLSFLDYIGGVCCDEDEDTDYCDLLDKTKEFGGARKLHEQWTDIMLQLVSFKFGQIGSLQEAPSGEFFVGPILHPQTASSERKVILYNGLEPRLKGPYSSTTEYYGVEAQLNRAVLVEDAYSDMPGIPAEVMYEYAGYYELFTEFQDIIFNERYASGPFYLEFEFCLSETLIDDDFNITGIEEFTGLIVDLPSVCQQPEIFRAHSYFGYIAEYSEFVDVFQNRESQYPSSALHSHEVRRDMMASSMTVSSYELGLYGPYGAPKRLDQMFKEIWNRPFDKEVEFERLASTRPWFKELHGLHKPRSTFSEWVVWISGTFMQVLCSLLKLYVMLILLLLAFDFAFNPA